MGGRFLVKLNSVMLGHEMRWLLFIASMRVEGRGLNKQACKYLAKSSFERFLAMMTFICSEEGTGRETSHNPSEEFRDPLRTRLLFFRISTLSLSKTA